MMTIATRRARYFTLLGYLDVFLLIPLWICYISPPTLLSQTSTTILWWSPLLMPLRGLILNKPYTFAWSGFLAVLYISQAITTLISSNTEQYLALIELLFASSWFTGAAMCARWRGE